MVRAMSSENGWIMLEGQYQARIAWSGGRGNVKKEWLEQVRREMSSENG